MKVKFYILLLFMLIQVNELFKNYNKTWEYVIKGKRAYGKIYDFTFPLEASVWYLTMFIFPTFLILIISNLTKDKDIKAMFWALCIWTVESTLSFSKPYGYIYLPDNFTRIPYIPISMDMFVGMFFIYIVFKAYLKDKHGLDLSKIFR